MAVISKSGYHSGSKISPAKPNLFLSQFNELLYKLESLEGVSTSTQVISYKLKILAHFHSNFFKVICIQQDIPKEQNEKLVELLLDRSLWMIDVCEIIRDVLMQTREGIQQLLLVFRRKLHEHDVAKEVSTHLNSRKIVKKELAKLLRTAESFGKKFYRDTSNKTEESISYLQILDNSQSISVDVFKSLFSYISGSNAISEASKWSLVSKLIHLRHEPLEEEDCSNRNKFEVVDSALHMLSRPKTNAWMKNEQIEKLRDHLEDLRLSVLDLERSLECLCRFFMKSRVILLN